MPPQRSGQVSLVLLAAVIRCRYRQLPVKVGSKNRYGILLGNIILQVLESHGVPTVNKVQLGTTPVRGDHSLASWISIRNIPAMGRSSLKMKTMQRGKRAARL